MAETTLRAEDNPALANDLVKKAVGDEETQHVAEIKEPFSGLVHLPAGYVNSAGEVFQTAEVRELNGHDEEAIVKNGTLARALNTVLERAVLKVGNEKATVELLDGLTIGDRNALLLGIYRASFGDTLETAGYCATCNETKEVLLSVEQDIPVTTLNDPVSDRYWKVNGKHEYACKLPTGKAQKAALSSNTATAAEIQTSLLQHCIVSIDGRPVLTKKQILDMPWADRRKVVESINKNAPGPVFETVHISCPDCEAGEVVVPTSIGAFFQF